MNSLLNKPRKLQILFLAFGLFLCVGIASAQDFTDSAPVLISQPDSTRALTAKPSKRGLKLASSAFPASEKTLITFFVTNLDLLENEGAKAFRVDVQDSSQKALWASDSFV